MKAVEQKKELHKIIDQVDSSLVSEFYTFTKTFLKMKEQEKMIIESEKDIQEGKIHSLDEVESIIKSWKE
ncbi:MAG: hypothetical protein ACK4RM_03990 [Flavobacterium sp.]